MTSQNSTRAFQILQQLGELDADAVQAMDNFPYEYFPESVAYPVHVPSYADNGLLVIVAENLKKNVCALMVCRKEDVLSCVLTANVLVRDLSSKTKLNSIVILTEEPPKEVHLSHTDPDFYPDSFLISKPNDFNFERINDSNTFFIVGFEDNVEGELRGLELLTSVQERTPFGITPPGVPQPKPKTRAQAKVVLRKKS